ncbi:hypothetical protein NDU88_000434 [Pleurodeles waltl]|uniref:Uncharacterized protein n=1 Tax=Pleurodeles waltl TaxID=8319 RepID=A0AAV7S6X7_PLEWA|nr:hypothetical protein NDU88_000434 [Pleurodeles waltl]
MKFWRSHHVWGVGKYFYGAGFYVTGAVLVMVFGKYPRPATRFGVSRPGVVCSEPEFTSLLFLCLVVQVDEKKHVIADSARGNGGNGLTHCGMHDTCSDERKQTGNASLTEQ